MSRLVVHFAGAEPAPDDCLLVSFDEGGAGAERASALLTTVEPEVREAYMGVGHA